MMLIGSPIFADEILMRRNAAVMLVHVAVFAITADSSSLSCPRLDLVTERSRSEPLELTVPFNLTLPVSCGQNPAALA